MNGIFKFFVCSLIFSFCAASPCFSADTADQPQEQKNDVVKSDVVKSGVVKSPSVFFPESTYKFNSAVEGQDILHDFVIMNKGTDILKVEKVKTG